MILLLMLITIIAIPVVILHKMDWSLSDFINHVNNWKIKHWLITGGALVIILSIFPIFNAVSIVKQRNTDAVESANVSSTSEYSSSSSSSSSSESIDDSGIEETDEISGTIENPVEITFDLTQEMDAKTFISKYKNKIIKFDGYIYMLDQAAGKSVKDVSLTIDRTAVNGGALKDADFSFQYLYSTDVSISLLWMLADADAATRVINERTASPEYDDCIPVTVIAKVEDVIEQDWGKEIRLSTVNLSDNEASVKSR